MTKKINIKYFKNLVHKIDLTQVDKKHFSKCFIGCIILTKDNKILLQQRGANWINYPGYLAEFGGHVESGEIPIQALLRELNEELGAIVNEADVVSIGAITEASSNHSELIYVYFWHDKHGTITGCYEGEAKHFDKVNDILKINKITDGLRWLLLECQHRHFLK